MCTGNGSAANDKAGAVQCWMHEHSPLVHTHERYLRQGTQARSHLMRYASIYAPFEYAMALIEMGASMLGCSDNLSSSRVGTDAP